MPDQKPPREIADERETLIALLQYQRDSVVRKVNDLSEDDARRSLVPTATTLLWLVKHLRRAESVWVEQRFAGRAVANLSDDVLPEDTVQSVVDAYRHAWATTAEIVAAAASLDELTRDTGSESPVSLRWILAHLLEETARHAGHADILRELIDGQTGR